MIELGLQFLYDITDDAKKSEWDGRLRKLTNAEEKRLAELDPELKLLFEETRKDLFQQQSPMVYPMDIYLVCGHRGKEAQTQAQAMGFSKVFYPNSKHNKMPALGMDCCPYPIDWNDLERFRLMNRTMMETAKRLNLKIRFGADFNMDGNLTNDKFVDLPHVEKIV